MSTAQIVSLPTANIPPNVQTLGWAQLAEQRPFLVHYAARRLADPLLAEDLVHDVFEAVMTGRARFEGRSSLRSWLVAVLEHKIVDLIRSRSGHLSLDAFGEGDDETPAFDIESDQPGPEDVAAQRQRLRQTLAGIAALPDSLRRVVELRVFAERSTDEVCQALGISEQNLFVRLHRARKALAS